MKKSIHDTPVLLLDDVLSELDSNRQNYLLNSIGNVQTIITCTGLDEFVNNRFEINKTFKIENGSLKEDVSWNHFLLEIALQVIFFRMLFYQKKGKIQNV